MSNFDFKDFRSRVDMDGLMGLGFRALRVYGSAL